MMVLVLFHFARILNREKSFQFNCNKLCVIKSHRLLAFLIHIKMFRVIQFSRCKPKTVFGSVNRGGDEGDRTPYPLLARQVLSQMSYTPICRRVAVGSLDIPCGTFEAFYEF